MAKSIKCILGITLSGKNDDNDLLSEQKRMLVSSICEFFEKKDTNYIIYEPKQTYVEEKRCVCSFFICYDTTRKDEFRAIDWNLEKRNRIVKIVQEVVGESCHFIVAEDEMFREEMINNVLRKYDEKYGTKLRKNEVFGFI